MVSAVELPPIQIQEHLDDNKRILAAQSPTIEQVPQAQSTNSARWNQEDLWLQGGLPDSLFAEGIDSSFAWGKDYLSGMLNQYFHDWDIDASDRLPEVFQWIANNNGEQFNETNCAKALSVKKESVRKSLKVLEKTGMVRCFPNWPVGSNQSPNSMPVYYVRDCGLLHAMLKIDIIDMLHNSSARGHSWESFAVENLVNKTQGQATLAFFRDRDKNEIDLVLNIFNGTTLAIELKVNPNKKAEQGFRIASEKIRAMKQMIVHSGEEDIRETGGEGAKLSLISAIRSLSQPGCSLWTYRSPHMQQES